eukprot:CAMPEP_0202704368 /NCGR_PEP_ID=MMETSP1385-20130828/17046_1 /ASSEMBLY_ACC=CAM_ASM_000861 /TAXON_ID=933848 /ORGANISM="Elphidium margaritaceum" /LENGTH=511 /DNA_ID=CAMNT_0049362365 /DNA_START=27 /DNA_END=1562 /DNA_ORIENTATION=-
MKALSISAWKRVSQHQRRNVQHNIRNMSADAHSEYRHPLITRYSSTQMRSIWSEQSKFVTWRRLWVALAQSQYELGLKGISKEQIESLQKNINNIDFEYAAKEEKLLRHDVMAHVHTYAHQCPDAAGIIHLGATSCYVQDNGDLVQMKEAGIVLESKLLKLMQLLRNACIEYASLPCLGYTHFQAAQLTTVGKRMGLWLQDLYWDYLHLSDQIDHLPLRGAKGTTGTQAAFLRLFDNDHEKVKQLEERVMEKMGFKHVVYLSGQNYSRKLDYNVLSTLSMVGQSLHKMCTDIRLLQSLKEMEEPFEVSQIGSSAMAYKRNPMRSERVCSLSRYLIGLPSYAAQTHSVQWLERSLDDSAIRRMVLPEAFLCCDAVLDICCNIVDGIVLWPHVIQSNVLQELPFMATENIIMEAVKLGGNRQELHEVIRVQSMEAAKQIKTDGKANDLIERLKQHEEIRKYLSEDDINQIIDPNDFVGRAPQQTMEFITDIIDPLLQQKKGLIDAAEIGEVNV